MTATTLATPEEAYFEFFRADSAQEAEAWAAVMSYPHVRVSAAGRVDYYETAEDYASRASWVAREGEEFDATGAVGVVERHLQDSVKGDLDSVVSAFGVPLVDVGVGGVVRHADAAEARSALAAAPSPRVIEDVSPAQTGRDGVVVTARWLAEGEMRIAAVFLVARQGDRWRIVGFSGMRA